MSNSLSDQLLRAGLITQEQIAKADDDKQKQKERARAKFKKKASSPQAQAKNKTAKPANKPKPAKKPTKEASDLAKFYQQRNQVEQAERTAEEKRKREVAERRRKTRKQIRQLIEGNVKNDEEATIRFNFVVGETVKYLFVTEEQQTQIAAGELSITFMDGKRCLISSEIGEQILALDPDKVMVRFTDDGSDSDYFPIPDAIDTEVETTAVPAPDAAAPETETTAETKPSESAEATPATT